MDGRDAVTDASGEQFIALATKCPRCGRRPALRISATLARAIGPGGRLGTYRCQGRRCGAIYDLPSTVLGAGP